MNPTTAPHSAEREAFEAWYSENGKWPNAVLRGSDGHYMLAASAAAWNVWQARARAQAGPHSAAATQPVELSDERIDYIADTIVRGMPDGIRGFCKTWGWRQFSRALLEACAGHYATPPAAPEPLLTAEGKPHAVYVEGFGYVDVRAVRAIERAHGIGATLAGAQERT